MNSEGRVINTQKNVVRTNCIDCLDRTNVVQTAIARRVLSVQLKSLRGELHVDKNLTVDANYSSVFMEPFENQVIILINGVL